ncbi:hypothetical protein B0T21DRAFT_355183 [Apiosordaria backusii]|uniref:Uncharacterized protein n=1 Tax=Apiosordaria backusii TaxID=314023 RepID=A0AA40EYC4_9PEZI|nr:hypothetical protein B0T21DRAFT_355183 [Apiosordaria backusii]
MLRCVSEERLDLFRFESNANSLTAFEKLVHYVAGALVVVFLPMCGRCWSACSRTLGVSRPAGGGLLLGDAIKRSRQEKPLRHLPVFKTEKNRACERNHNKVEQDVRSKFLSDKEDPDPNLFTLLVQMTTNWNHPDFKSAFGSLGDNKHLFLAQGKKNDPYFIYGTLVSYDGHDQALTHHQPLPCSSRVPPTRKPHQQTASDDDGKK